MCCSGSVPILQDAFEDESFAFRPEEEEVRKRGREGGRGGKEEGGEGGGRRRERRGREGGGKVGRRKGRRGEKGE